jgi:hypothetical protein
MSRSGLALLFAMIFLPAFTGTMLRGEDLAQQLHASYIETMMDPSGLKVSKPGSTLVVQIDGVMANPNKNRAAPFPNSFEDGQVKPDTALGLIKNPFSKLKASSAERALTVGEKVYLLKVELNPDSIALTVQSCGDCDPKVLDPAHQPYRAKVTFKFLKGALGATDMKHVQQTVDKVFKLPDAASDTGTATGDAAAGGSAQPAAAPAAAAPAQQTQQFAPIAPPPPAPAAPRKVALGMTIDEVKSSYGEPANVVDLGGKVIYVYKDLKITFKDGKVSDVDVL